MDEAVDNEAVWARRRTLVASVFTPASPITNRDLFAGRVQQLERLLDVAEEVGKHAIIYGERGVGKTSIARVLNNILEEPALVLYYTCSSAETFALIWTGILNETEISSQRLRAGFARSEYEDNVVPATALLRSQPGTVSPNHVRAVLKLLSSARPVVVFLDEFDRIEDQRTRNQFADTVKLLADERLAVTLVLVGVGDTVDDLVHQHESIARNLSQVPMPRMSNGEIEQIIERGMKASDLSVSPSFVKEVVSLSQGLPHYTHLLSQHGAMAAISSRRGTISADDFASAIAAALNDVSETVRDKYYRATVSNRETIYREVLLACALAPKDEMGSFAPADVRDKLLEITQSSYQFAAFAPHLRDFSGDGVRGGVLQRRGERRPRYKFIDPLLPPYVLMRGRLDNTLPAGS